MQAQSTENPFWIDFDWVYLTCKINVWKLFMEIRKVISKSFSSNLSVHDEDFRSTASESIIMCRPQWSRSGTKRNLVIVNSQWVENVSPGMYWQQTITVHLKLLFSQKKPTITDSREIVYDKVWLGRERLHWVTGGKSAGGGALYSKEDDDHERQRATRWKQIRFNEHRNRSNLCVHV